MQRAAARLETLLADDLMQEEAARRLIEIFAGQGRRAESLRVYAALVRASREGLGVAPEDATRELAERVREGTGMTWNCHR